MLGISRQSVSKTLIQADRAVRQGLMDAAKSYKISLYRMSPEKGIASGFSKALNSPVLVTYSPERGVNIWYKHTGLCKDCDQEDECRETILAEAQRLGVPPTDLVEPGGDVEDSPPAKLSERLIEIVFPKGAG